MTTRAAVLAITALLAASSAGCRRGGAAPATPPGPAGPNVALVPTKDYRTLNQAAIEIMIANTGGPVTLKPAGPNKYTGTRQLPGESMTVPVTVTVEEKRIIVETRGGGLTSRQIITEHGIEKDGVW
jgi:hypothetical protein